MVVTAQQITSIVPQRRRLAFDVAITPACIPVVECQRPPRERLLRSSSCSAAQGCVRLAVATHPLALRVLPEKEQPSLRALLVFSGGPFFSAQAMHARGLGQADVDSRVNVAPARTHAADAGAEHWRRDGRRAELGEAGGWGPRGTTAWINIADRRVPSAVSDLTGSGASDTVFSSSVTTPCNIRTR